MKPLLSLHTSATAVASPFFRFTESPSLFPRFRSPPLLRTHFLVHSVTGNGSSYQPANQASQDPQNQQDPRRTLYPGGYKRPEIKVPNLVLQLDPEEVLGGGNVLDLIDQAVAKWVGIVLLNGAEGGGGRLYEAACLLKSVVQDRAYFLIGERVDIAAAVNASGVVLSDQGLPAMVARNTMLDSGPKSVLLPLVARIVQTVDAAMSASSSEGADFIIYGSGEGGDFDIELNSLFKNVKIPIFLMYSLRCEATRIIETSQYLRAGAGGLVISLEDLRLFSIDGLTKLLDAAYTANSKTEDEVENLSDIRLLDLSNDLPQTTGLPGFVQLEDREKQLIATERLVLLKAINVIQKAAPLMEEVSLLIDALSQIDEPFLLVIVGEFNSGKSTVINALLGKRYLKEGIVPTTNEITFLRYSELESEGQQRCERYPDGQYVCYLPAPILKDMNIVDTPGTNVILQRQQRLTEEFVPRADLLLFVISADRPLSESEVAFLRYIRQWKKKVVFVLNKSDIYRNAQELEEAISFVKENSQKLLNTEHVILYPVSARSALEAKLSASSVFAKDHTKLLDADSHWTIHSFYELENFLYSFLDSSSSAGLERIQLKLRTPIAIAECLISASEKLLRQDCEHAKEDLASAKEIIDSVNQYAIKMENESISWRRRALSLIDVSKSRVMELIESTLRLSNLDLVASYVFKGEKSSTVPANSRIQNDILAPALSDALKLLGEYVTWLQSNNAREGRFYKECFENKWPSFVNSRNQIYLDTYDLLKKVDELSVKVIENFSASATSKVLEQEIREVFLGTFGGLGAAGLSASLLTSVLPTTLEDLLALGFCSAGGYIAISNFPARRQAIINKVNTVANALAHQLEDAMQKDLLETVSNLETFVRIIGKPYEEEAQHRLDQLLDIQSELSNVETKLKKLQVEIQNLHVS